MSIRPVLTLILALVLPLFAFQGLSSHNLREAREEEVGQEVKRLLDLLDTEQQRVVASIQQTLDAMAEIDRTRFADDACAPTLSRLKGHLSNHLELSFADPNGTIVCTTRGQGIGRSIADRAAFRGAMTSGATVGRYDRGLTDGRHILALASPHFAADGRVDGAVSAMLDLRWVEDYFARKPLPEGAAMMIADSDGVILFRHPAIPELIGRTLPEPYRSHQREGGGRIRRITGFDGIERIVASTPLGASGNGLSVAYGVPRAAALASTDTVILRSLGIFGAILALTGAAAAWGMRQHMRLRDAMFAAARTAADELAHERTLLQAVLEHLPCGLLVIGSPDGGLVLRSHASRGILGIDAAAPGAFGQIQARTHQFDGAPQDAGRHPILRALTRGERVEQEEILYRHPVGRTIRLVTSAAPIRDADGRVTHAIATFIDATERKAMVTEMLRKEAHLEMALSAAEAYAWSCDLRTGRMSWSQGAIAAMGFPATDQGVTADWLSVVHPQDRASVEAGMTRTMHGLQPGFRSDFRVLKAGGGTRWISFRGRVLSDVSPDEIEGDPCRCHLVGLAIDITERKTIEGVLCAAKEDADRASVAKSKFLAAASHDLRQPIQSLFLFAGGLRRHVNETGRTRLAHLERSLDTLKAMLDSLLDVSRYDSGAVEPAVSDFPVQSVVDEIAACYAPIAAAKGIAWEAIASGTVVRSDPNLLGRMVRNLIENAIRYTERGAIRLVCREEGGLLRIEVYDTGIGIPADHLNRIWDEFHQVGNPGRDREKGLGLGLAIVKRLAGLLGATVEVRSQPEQGSCFSFGVPIVSTAAEMAECAPASIPGPDTAGDDRLAVVVDDDSTVLMSLQTLLMDWSFRVIVAGDPDVAVRRARESNRTPAIIIADYNLLEGRTGIEAIWRIREACGEDIPGILLTGDSEMECRREAAAHGLHVMQKPVTPRELAAILAARALAA